MFFKDVFAWGNLNWPDFLFPSGSASVSSGLVGLGHNIIVFFWTVYLFPPVWLEARHWILILLVESGQASEHSLQCILGVPCQDRPSYCSLHCVWTVVENNNAKTRFVKNCFPSSFLLFSGALVCHVVDDHHSILWAGVWWEGSSIFVVLSSCCEYLFTRQCERTVHMEAPKVISKNFETSLKLQCTRMYLLATWRADERTRFVRDSFVFVFADNGERVRIDCLSSQLVDLLDHRQHISTHVSFSFVQNEGKYVSKWRQAYVLLFAVEWQWENANIFTAVHT